MSILAAVLPDILGKVLDKVLGQLPVSENEKEHAKVVVEAELAKNSGAIADAEATISNNAKEVWLEELHNGGFLATTWRPLLAVTSTFIVFWDGVLLPVVNSVLTHPITGTPTHISEVVMWVLLTLIGARGIEKISVVRNKK